GVGGTSAWITLLFRVVLGPFLIGFLAYYWQFSPMARVLRLKAPQETLSLADTEAVAGLEQYRGQIGRTLTPHQPSGQVEIFGKRLESTADGMLLEAGQHVKGVGLREGHLVQPPAGGRML